LAGSSFQHNLYLAAKIKTMQTRITPITFLLITILSWQACFAGGSDNAKSLAGVLDSTLVWNWDGNSSYNQLVSGTWLTYDANNNNTTWLSKSYNGGNWTNSSLHTNTFDNNNNLTLYLDQVWGGTAWTNSQQTTYTYDGSHNQLSRILQTWVSGAWVNNAQTINHYNGNLVESAILQTWVSGAWATTDSFVYTYDGSNNLLNETDLYWSAGTWTNNQDSVYTYSGGNRTSAINQTWTGAAWANVQKDVYTFTNNKLTGDITYVYNGSIQITQQNLMYGYDIGGNNTSIITQGEQGNSLVNQDSTHLYYHGEASGINNIAPLSARISVYPNPSKYVISVAYHSVDLSPVVATLYDITGRPVITQTVSEGVQQIDVHELSAGVYQMAFTNNKGAREVKRVVIE
jgi:hypothetical protein